MEQVQAMGTADRQDAALALVREHCDIEERLRAVPPSATVRGLYLKSFEPILRPAGKALAYRTIFPDDNWSAIRMYPLRDYSPRLAVSGALLESPDRGMQQGWRTNGSTSAVATDSLCTFESCGVHMPLETRLNDRFNRSTVIRW